SNLGVPSSNLEVPSSNLGVPSSNLEVPSSNLEVPSSKLRITHFQQINYPILWASCPPLATGGQDAHPTMK
ncbi:MAG: hypothetical protein V7K14_12450, partial [Nostoc sp.]|uniref:hypothetical protein n=1 Tax=Nostoc sp. TaxID=1180 RepID=UPI002FF97AD5